jgi:two-component system, OmpR family, sensor histidine kinase VicK
MIIIQRIFPLFFYIYKGKCYLSEGELTEVLYEEQNVIRSELQLFSNSKEKVDTCMNYTRPPLAITIEPIRGAFVDAKKRDVKLRYLTEITKDNVSYCKELIPLVDEMRHLDGIKGNFMISELEYLAPIILFEKGKIASQIIYSNQKEIVEQHQYMFDTLWNKAISAQQRIKEIEGGVIGQEHYQTRFLENPNEVSEELKKITDTSEDDSWSICSTFDGLLMITCNKDFEKMQGRLVDSSRRGKNTRWVGTINKNNIDLVKAYLDLGMKIRHIDNMPPMNFAISSKELYITIDEMKGGQIAKNLLISNEPPYIRHYISIFEDLWNKSVPAEEKIREIKEGVVIGKTEVIQNPQDIQQLFINMVKSAKHEILLLLPTINAFYRKERIGIIELLKQASKREDNRVNVRILTPTKDTIEEKLQNMVAASEQRDTKRENGGEEEQQIKTKKKSFDIRHIDVESTKEANAEVFAEVARKSAAVTTVTIVVVDRKESLVIEKKDDSKHNFIEAVGMATYSNSKPTVLSYVSIFENLWRQSELYQQLKESNKQLEQANDQLEKQDKIQKEFINIAAHELRTPIQPILGLTQIIYPKLDKDVSRYEKEKQKEMLEVVIRNANRLQRLSEDILDVTRIESQNLNLKLERLNLDEIISNAINDAKRSHQIKDNVSLLYQRDKYDNNDSVFIQADRGRLNQVISNLISNAIKFTKEGSIIVNAKKEERENKVIVSLKDSGIGIDPEVLPRLFQKFATKSYQGTGLGLYISKSIVEAHGGRMWAENNTDGKGAVFYFTLPIIDRKEEKRK